MAARVLPFGATTRQIFLHPDRVRAADEKGQLADMVIELLEHIADMERDRARTNENVQRQFRELALVVGAPSV